MTTIIDYILDLFRSPDLAGAFVADPAQALRDAGLPNVTAAQLQAVAATAAPAGVALGGGDPVLGLQRAVADHHSIASSFAPMYAPQRTFAPETDVASHNRTNAEFLSPDQSSGANSQVGGFNLGFGDITFGNKSTTTATDGGVIVDGPNTGTVTTGDDNVVGDENITGDDNVVGDDNTKVDVETGNHSPVIIGDENEVEDNSQVAGDDIISDNEAPVLNDVDTSGGNGGGSVADGGLIGGGHSSGGDGGNGGGITIIDNSGSLDASDDDSSVVTVVDTDTEIDNSVDNSVDNTLDVDNTIETNVDAGLF